MTGIIVLCRYNSTRLPGKILKKINGKEILGYILERLRVLGDKYPIVVCTSVEQTDDPIVAFCKKNNVQYYRGNLDNVALRFLNCAKENSFECAVRINGDNLFLDAHLISSMIAEMESDNLKFISNVKGRTFPRGMSIEIVRTAFYEESYPLFSERDHEHVMTYFYNVMDEKVQFTYSTEKSGQGLNFAIDTDEDFKNASNIICDMKKDHTQYGYREIIGLFKKTKYDR